ncbi:FtsQ-type POTRA domain-containing protein [bacterium]|nr:FtsQ-type POTRA domain-containing protein [bacterium]
MKKRTSEKINNSPKWKQRQVASRRKSPGSHRSGGGSGGFGGGIVRFLAGCAVLCAVFWFAGIPVVRMIASYPVFNIRDVKIKGAQYLDSEKLMTTAGIETGTNIFALDLENISQSLKTAFTTENIIVYRRLPNTIVIEVRERKPVALLNMNTLVGVDKDGVPLPHIGADMVETLPIVTGIKSVTSLSDSTVKSRLLTGLKMLDRISKDAPAVYARISEVDVSNTADMGISLVDNGLQVIIGDRDWKQKIPNLEKVINEVTWRRNDAKAVDLRFGEKVIVRK